MTRVCWPGQRPAPVPANPAGTRPGCLLAVLLHEQPGTAPREPKPPPRASPGARVSPRRAEWFAVPDKGPQYAVDKAAGALLAQLAGEQDALIHSGPFGHTVQKEQLIEPHLKGTQYLGVELVHGFAAIGGHNAPQGDLPFQYAIEQRGGKGPVPGGIRVSNRDSATRLE